MKENLVLFVVEDDDVDQEFIRRSFRKVEHVHLKFMDSAEDALKTLRENRREDNPQKQMLFLDINLPGMSGLDFLEEIRGDASLQDLIVVILSSSDADKDVKRAYQHNVAAYIKKSDAGDNIDELRGLVEFYLSMNTFPQSYN